MAKSEHRVKHFVSIPLINYQTLQRTKLNVEKKSVRLKPRSQSVSARPYTYPYFSPFLKIFASTRNVVESHENAYYTMEIRITCGAYVILVVSDFLN